MKTRRNVKHKRSKHKRSKHKRSKHKRSKHKRSKHKRSKHKRSKHKRSQSKRSSKKAKHTKKRGRVVTRKMRGGYVDLIKMKPYPSNFSKKDKNEQKNVFKKFSKEINEICKEIQGFIDYKYLSADKRKILLDEFNRKRDLFVDIINKVQLDLTNQEYKENDKKIIDLTNMQHHTENLLNTFMECYSTYTQVEVVKDSAGEVVRSLNPRSSSKSKSRSPKYESPEYMSIKDDSLVSNYSIFADGPPRLPKRSIDSDEVTNYLSHVKSIPKAEEPRRRVVVRGKKEEVSVLPEFTRAQEAIADLDKFLSSERKK